MNDDDRIALAAQCGDCERIPKVRGAGSVVADEAGDYQIMHNGIKTRTDGHYGNYNVEVIRRLRGHHEPQEEYVFDQVLRRVRRGGTIMEVGSFWAYYSLWFQHAVQDGRAFMVEPLESALDAGRRNFALNGQHGVFIRAAIAARTAGQASVELWPGTTTSVRRTTIDALLDECELNDLDILHADVQGHEVEMLRGASRALRLKKIRWIFISTHGENIHQRCLVLLRHNGYSIVAQHTPAESYSVDGLIVASASPLDQRVSVSRRRSVHSAKAKLRAAVRVRLLEPLKLKPETT